MGEHPRPSINARLKDRPFASFLVPQDSRDDAESREAVVDALDAWVFIGAADRVSGSALGCREICDGEGEEGRERGRGGAREEESGVVKTRQKRRVKGKEEVMDGRLALLSLC